MFTVFGNKTLFKYNSSTTTSSSPFNVSDPGIVHKYETSGIRACKHRSDGLLPTAQGRRVFDNRSWTNTIFKYNFSTMNTIIHHHHHHTRLTSMTPNTRGMPPIHSSTFAVSSSNHPLNQPITPSHLHTTTTKAILCHQTFWTALP